METTSSKKLWRANENVLTSAKQYQERLSGPGTLGASAVSSKAQALEGQVLLGQCLVTENVEPVKICFELIKFVGYLHYMASEFKFALKVVFTPP